MVKPKHLSHADQEYISKLFSKLKNTPWSPRWTTVDLARLAIHHYRIPSRDISGLKKAQLIRKLKVAKGITTKGKLAILLDKTNIYRTAPFSIKKIRSLYKKLPALKK